jgi:hypothetical protein
MLPAALAFLAGTSTAQFVDEFDDPSLDGWTSLTGDGRATVSIRPGPGVAAVRVDATEDRLNIWWALVKHEVSDWLDLSKVEQPGTELRIETRIRVSHAPRRVNLHLNTQRTVDFHTHLMEFDIADTTAWHTISMTTRGFDARPGDTVNAQMALMDWGNEVYRVTMDYFRVDVVDAATSGPDLGEPLPYHPPAPEATRFQHHVAVQQDAMIDSAFPGVNFDRWSISREASPSRVLSVDGTRWAIMRWDLSEWSTRKVPGAGLLELTVHEVQKPPPILEEFGSVRIVEILGGNPDWDRQTVTFASLVGKRPAEHVFNSQMIIDVDPWPEAGSVLRIPLSRPVVQRLIDGTTRGLLIKPLGPLSAAFMSSEHENGAHAPALHFDIAPD